MCVSAAIDVCVQAASSLSAHGAYLSSKLSALDSHSARLAAALAWAAPAARRRALGPDTDQAQLRVSATVISSARPFSATKQIFVLMTSCAVPKYHSYKGEPAGNSKMNYSSKKF